MGGEVGQLRKYPVGYWELRAQCRVIRVVIANHRGGAGKTTTAVNYAWYLASRQRRTLLIDGDTQGSIGILLGLHPAHSFRDFIIDGRPLEECVIPAGSNLDVMCGGKELVQVESSLSASSSSPELALDARLQSSTQSYDAVVIDVSPAINLLQACAIVYARNVIIPVSMDLLSLTGAAAVCDMIAVLNHRAGGTLKIRGLLPCQVDQRLGITKVVYEGLASVSGLVGVQVLPPIRTDQTVQRAWQSHRALLAYAPAARASHDYTTAFEQVTQEIEGSTDEQKETGTEAV